MIVIIFWQEKSPTSERRPLDAKVRTTKARKFKPTIVDWMSCVRSKIQLHIPYGHMNCLKSMCT
jgi:hypothetical protein